MIISIFCFWFLSVISYLSRQFLLHAHSVKKNFTCCQVPTTDEAIPLQTEYLKYGWKFKILLDEYLIYEYLKNPTGTIVPYYSHTPKCLFASCWYSTKDFNCKSNNCVSHFWEAIVVKAISLFICPIKCTYSLCSRISERYGLQRRGIS